MFSAFAFVIFFCIIGGAYGHAALVTPKPWWWAASRDRPCGGAIPKAIWQVGSNQSLTWWVIAGDGMGEVHVKLNLDGTTNFSTNATQWLTVQQPKIASLGYFALSAIVPNVQCRGPNNTCTLQFNTDSGGGWYSCTTVKIVCNGCEAGAPISRDQCVKAGNLSFCNAKSGQQVSVPAGQSAAQIDGLTQDTFNLNHQNPNVFTKGNSSACLADYKEMLCELYLATCGNSSSSYTRQKCNQTLYTTCGLTANHSSLYNCSVFPSAPVTTTSKPTTTGTTTTSKSTTTTTTAKSTTSTTTTTTGTVTTTKNATSSTTTSSSTGSTTTKSTITTGKSARSERAYLVDGDDDTSTADVMMSSASINGIYSFSFFGQFFAVSFCLYFVIMMMT